MSNYHVSHPNRKFNQSEWMRLAGGKGFKATIKVVCGEKIGSGISRDVYVYKKNPNFVVKIERPDNGGLFANVTEFRNYMNNKEWKWFGKFLAPCVLINETGTIMVQQRVEFKDRKYYPKKVPVLFTDIKMDNFGWIGDQFVCCDYAFLVTPMQTKKYKRVYWKKL